MTSRRTFLRLSGAGAVTAAATPAALAQESVTPEGISTLTIEEAEKLTGVSNPPAAREMLVDTMDRILGPAAEVRELGLANEDPAPALVFDPRLPGTPIPDAAWRTDELADRPLPASDEDIAFSPVGELAGWLRRGALTSSRLTRIYLDRIERFAPRLECMVTVTADLAVEQAARADAEIERGEYRGLLHGIPYGAKDLFDTRDIPTTWGATPYRERVADQDAAVIERLEAAGAVLLGKTALGALAFGDLWFDGLTRNPWNPEEGSGGSSAGSGSAVAAGLMPFALGTETLGSIENPASRNGVAGLRPSFGRVSRHGAMVLCWSLDKVGVLARSAADSLYVLAELNGQDDRDPGSIEVPLAYDAGAPVEDVRIGYDPQWFAVEGLPADVAAIPGMLDDIGMELVEISLPDRPWQGLVPILYAEAAAAHEELVLSGEIDQLRGQTALAWPNSIRRARFYSAVDLVQAQRLRRIAMQDMQALYEDLDVIVGPGLMDPALSTPMTVITNFTGHPSLTLPVGFAELATRRSPLVIEEHYGGPASTNLHQVPVTIGLWGRLFEEGRLVRIGTEIERRVAFPGRPPV